MSPIQQLKGCPGITCGAHMTLTFDLQMAYLCINPFPNKPWFSHVCSRGLLKTLGKGEIARNEQFLLFPQCFLTVMENFLPFSSNSKLLSANSFNLEESKISHLGKG